LIKTESTLVRESVDQNYGVFSLSERFDSLLMWAHYASDHRWFVVEFDGSHPWLNQGSADSQDKELDAGGVRKVTYSDERPTATIVVEFSLQPKSRSIPLSKFIDCYFIKGSDWSYEREWRLVKRLDQATETILVSKNRIALFQVPSTAITSIILGARMSPAERRVIPIMCRQRRELNHVSLLQADLSKDRFALEFSPVEKLWNPKQGKSQKSRKARSQL
jgi:hypothetical protein